MSDGELDEPPMLIDTRDLAAPSQDTESATPVTIVTGYLGSGKSTLLKHIVQTYGHKKIAIVLNEFGQTSDIERSLMVKDTNADGIEMEQWVELDNGCMCCTAKDAGVSAIEKLMDRKGKYDHVIIETSGLADPAPIANIFWLDDALMSRVKLDGVVTVVDARTLSRSLEDGALASVQIACSDVIVVNKCDAVDEPTLDSVVSQVRAINGAATILQSSYGNVDPGSILNIEAYSSFKTSDKSFSDVHGTHENAKAVDDNKHAMSTIIIPLSGARFNTPADIADFESKLQHILWKKELNDLSFEVHRCKGRIQYGLTSDKPQTKIIQGVRETYETIDVDFEENGESKLVLIGQGLLPIEQPLRDFFSA